MRYLVAVSTVAFLVTQSACTTLTDAQSSRNAALWDAARRCQYGTVRVDRISNDGIPHTTTFNSGGSDFVVFRECYVTSATPIWLAYCAQEPANPQCGTASKAASSPSPQADVLDRVFRSRIKDDPELSGLVRRTPPGPREFEATIVLDGNEWQKLTQSQQHRVLRTIGTHMQESLRTAQPTPPRHSFSAKVYDEMLAEFATIVVRGPDDEISYQTYRGK